VLPKNDVDAIRRYVDAKQAEIPEDYRNQASVELELDARAATIYEGNNFEPDDSDGWFRVAVARLRYTATKRE
jgi:hypothetical protein